MRSYFSPWILPLITCAGLVVGAPYAQDRTKPASAPIVGPNGEPTLAPLLARAMPAVVSVGVSGRVAADDNPLAQDPFFRRFFRTPGHPRSLETQAAGSGVIVDASKGYILTNNHVVRNAEKIRVGLQDGRNVDAELVGADPESDVAVIRVSANELTSLPLGNSDDMHVGDFVVAIGNPFGLNQTATHGIVSAIGRNGLGIGGYEDYIQTDASINPGNSGGALVNMRGELIGINTAIVGPNGGNVGIGFAIPINMAQEIVRQLVDHGSVHRGQLGIVVQDLVPELVREVHAEVEHGALIRKVLQGSAADDAGLREGDIVISIDGAPVKSGADVRNKIGVRQVGDKVRIELIRDGRRKTVDAEIRATIADRMIQRVGRPEVAALGGLRGLMERV